MYSFDSTQNYTQNSQRNLNVWTMSDAEIDQAIHCMSNEPPAFDPFALFAARMQLAEE